MIPDVLMPNNKGEDSSHVLDRLRRRIDNYRKRHDESVPRYDNTISSQNLQQKQETCLLKQKFIEASARKKSAKKSEKKQHSENTGSSCVRNIYLIYIISFD